GPARAPVAGCSPGDAAAIVGPAFSPSHRRTVSDARSTLPKSARPRARAQAASSSGSRASAIASRRAKDSLRVFAPVPMWQAYAADCRPAARANLANDQASDDRRMRIKSAMRSGSGGVVRDVEGMRRAGYYAREAESIPKFSV